MPQKAKNPLKSIETTFEILNLLKRLDGAGVSELASELEIPKSTIHNYLSTLEQEEYVVNNGGEYVVGIRFLELGAYAKDQKEIYNTAKEEIDKLAEQTGELTNLFIEEHGRGTYLYRANGNDAVSVDAQVGTRVYLHSTALGKAILSELPRERVEGIIETHGLPKITPRTITKPNKLFKDLEKVQEKGVAYDDEERLEGLRCVAAPITDINNRVLGAISVSGPTKRIRDQRFQKELPTKVLETANVIELDLTYS